VTDEIWLRRWPWNLFEIPQLSENNPPGKNMDIDTRPASAVLDANSAISWGAIAAGGAMAAAALSLALIAFGAGLGLSSISPWSNSGVSAATFKTGAGIYVVLVAVMSSAVGGYLAARLRAKWVGVLAASLAAVEGGSLRDGPWNDRILTPLAI
jgi:hypothetical protein